MDTGARIENGIHRFPVRIYYSHTDAGGVVYHSRYIDMAEHARSELFRQLGGNQKELLHEEGLAFVVRSMDVRYNRPAFLDDLLIVETTISKCEAVTLVFDQKIYRGEELLCEILVKAGTVSLKDGRPKAMPRDWREKMDSVYATETRSV